MARLPESLGSRLANPHGCCDSTATNSSFVALIALNAGQSVMNNRMDVTMSANSPFRATERTRPGDTAPDDSHSQKMMCCPLKLRPPHPFTIQSDVRRMA
jgi:hypothetical protein